MTKKFWNDWKSRLKETKNIYTTKYYNWGRHVLHETMGESIIEGTFHGDKVDLVIERHFDVVNKLTRRLEHCVGYEYLTLHRNDIITVTFK